MWQFTTRGTHHFEWSLLQPTQVMNQTFAAMLTAKDEAADNIADNGGVSEAIDVDGAGQSTLLPHPLAATH